MANLAAEFNVPFLGVVPTDEGLEDALGDVERLRRSPVYRSVASLAEGLF